MIKLLLPGRKGSPLKVLCLGAHSDDIEIGCGGTILRLLEDHDNVDIYWVVFSAESARSKEARESAGKFLTNAIQKKIVIKKFKDGFFPYNGGEIKSFFEKLKGMFNPDLIFTHYRHDLHQDHRLISDLTWNTFRNHFILEYEVVKYDGDFGIPNFYIHLNDKICQKKLEYILNCYKTQRIKNWFSDDTFLSMLRIRGVESNAPEKYAEAFYSRKMVF